MKKIPCLILIDREAHIPTDDLNPVAVARLVSTSEVVATRKRDGQPVKFLGGEVGDLTSWVTRRAVAPGKNAPAGFILEETDPNTGKAFGWEPIASSSITKPLRQALENFSQLPAIGETFELCDPKIQSNPEALDKHTLFAHGSEVLEVPEVADIVENGKTVLDDTVAAWRAEGIEGVVFWVDGEPAVKVRVKDFSN